MLMLEFEMQHTSDFSGACQLKWLGVPGAALGITGVDGPLDGVLGVCGIRIDEADKSDGDR